MEYSREITKRLYDKHGFIADNFHDPQMCKLYNDLTVNSEEYESLFWHFGCRLKFEHKCYFLEREMEKPSVFDPRGQAMLTLTGKI